MTYQTVADHLGIEICQGEPHEACPGEYPESLHRTGKAEWFADHWLIHWAPRSMNRKGFYNFLRRAWMSRQPAGIPLWQRKWIANVNAAKTANDLGFRLPRRMGDPDRAYIRLALRDPGIRSRNADARRAWRWAHKT